MILLNHISIKGLFGFWNGQMGGGDDDPSDKMSARSQEKRMRSFLKKKVKKRGIGNGKITAVMP